MKHHGTQKRENIAVQKKINKKHKFVKYRIVHLIPHCGKQNHPSLILNLRQKKYTSGRRISFKPGSLDRRKQGKQVNKAVFINSIHKTENKHLRLRTNKPHLIDCVKPIVYDDVNVPKQKKTTTKRVMGTIEKKSIFVQNNTQTQTHTHHKPSKNKTKNEVREEI